MGEEVVMRAYYVLSPSSEPSDLYHVHKQELAGMDVAPFFKGERGTV